jgi:hypothetical protein
MTLGNADDPELRRWVQRLVDADLIVAGDGEALLSWITPTSPVPQPERERLLRLLETLVAEGDLSAMDAAPMLSAVCGVLEAGRAG